MPAILEAVESYATVGEIAESMRTVFGEYRARRAPKDLIPCVARSKDRY